MDPVEVGLGAENQVVIQDGWRGHKPIVKLVGFDQLEIARSCDDRSFSLFTETIDQVIP